MLDIFAPTSEQALCASLDTKFDGLGARCIWRKEVRMLCWTHASRTKAATLRIDYVICLDGGPLLGIEVKAAPQHAADLGRALLQCAHYSQGVIGAATVERVPSEWVGKPLAAVFLRTQANEMNEFVRAHATSAHRLFGPANVGFLFFPPRGMELRLCGERYWTEERGFHQGMTNKTSRSGNGKFHPE